MEIAYFLGTDHRGLGLGTEIAREAARAAFEDLELDDVVLFTLTTNSRSQAVIAKLGAEFERTVDHAGLAHVLFRLTGARWIGVRCT